MCDGRAASLSRPQPLPEGDATTTNNNTCFNSFCKFCLPFCQPCCSLDLSSHRCRFDRWLVIGRPIPPAGAAACAFAAGVPEEEAAAPTLLVPGGGTFPIRSPSAIPWFGPDRPGAVLLVLPVVELVFVLGALADGAAVTPEFAASPAPVPDGELRLSLPRPRRKPPHQGRHQRNCRRHHRYRFRHRRLRSGQRLRRQVQCSKFSWRNSFCDQATLLRFVPERRKRPHTVADASRIALHVASHRFAGGPLLFPGSPLRSPDPVPARRGSATPSQPCPVARENISISQCTLCKEAARKAASVFHYADLKKCSNQPLQRMLFKAPGEKQIRNKTCQPRCREFCQGAWPLSSRI